MSSPGTAVLLEFNSLLNLSSPNGSCLLACAIPDFDLVLLAQFLPLRLDRPGLGMCGRCRVFALSRSTVRVLTYADRDSCRAPLASSRIPQPQSHHQPWDEASHPDQALIQYSAFLQLATWRRYALSPALLLRHYSCRNR